MPPLSFITRGASMRPDTEDENDPGALVEQLLSRLEQVPVPAPPQTRPSQRILGSIGDALLAMATVRAGGAPPAMGPFAASQARIAQEYRDAKRSAEESNIENRNRVRIGAFEEELRRKREKEVATIRGSRMRAFQLKQFRGTDRSGKPVMVPYNYDPNTATLAPVPGFESGFQQYIRPFLAQGVNTETGELEFKLVDPFMQSGGGGQAEPSDGTRTIGGIEPKPTAGEAEAVESASVIKGQLADFKKLASEYAIRKRANRTVRALGQTAVRKLPVIGQELSEAYGDPDFEKLSALRNRIGQQLARLVENGRLSDEDRAFALENLPTIVSLTTEEGRRQAGDKIALVEREIEARMARKRRLRPGLTGGGGTTPTVDDILRQYDEEIQRANPTP